MSERFSDEVLQRVLDAASEPEPFEAMRAVLEAHAPTPEQVVLHEQYVVDHAADHDDDCPEDDTCACSMRPRNDAVNAVCRYLSTGAASDGSPR